MDKFYLVSSATTGINKIPVVNDKALLKEGLDQMREKGLGVVCIVSSNNELRAIFTDGDLRRLILNVHKPLSAFFMDDIIDHAKENPIVISEDSSLDEAIKIMAKKRIWDLPVVSIEGKFIGLFHLHDGLKKFY
jgi:arabinose-5-phosphate isomerase